VFEERLLTFVRREGDEEEDAESTANTEKKYEASKGTEMRDFHDENYAEEYSEREFDDDEFSDSEYSPSIVKTNFSSKSSYPPSSYPPSYVSSPTKSYRSHSKYHDEGSERGNHSSSGKKRHGGSTKSKRSKSRDSRNKRREKPRYEEEEELRVEVPPSKPYDPNEPVASMIV
jgi:hypothetical protein